MSINMNTPSEQDVLDLTRHFTPLAMRFAQGWSLDLDDVKQEIALIIIETLPRIPDTSGNVHGYLHRTIKNHFLSRYDEKRSHKPLHVLSLDEPYPSYPEITRADMLAAPSDVPQDDTQQIQREQALYAALRRLHKEEQEYVRRVYGLHAFTPWGKRTPRERNPIAICQTTYRKLRKDAVLVAALGVTR
jgi:DNA-directed RNA polymerase specialized sigma24 family protein